MTAQIEDLATEVTGDPPTDPPPGREWFGFRRLVVVLVAMAVLLTALGGWFLWRAEELRSAPGASNVALVDTGRTAEVSAAVTTALNQIFSYSYDRTEVTEQAATDVLRGAARDTYDKLFAQVRELAPAQKLILTTRVVSAAVQVLDGDRAKLLVFLDQSATRAGGPGDGAGNAAAAQLSVTAERDGDRWVITGLEPR
ncbi:MAG TPA: hypothetical protein VNP92_14270 [Actinophytocola sp.]|nr:hypothetical protein [Actinophytocola sp.]